VSILFALIIHIVFFVVIVIVFLDQSPYPSLLLHITLKAEWNYYLGGILQGTLGCEKLSMCSSTFEAFES
jgi:hypothetical protein